jgi:hypothetical protein
MTGYHDEIWDIGDIPEHEANELRELIRKVLNNHIEEFIDQLVVSVYNAHNRPLTSSALDTLLQEEIPKENLNELQIEGLDAFLGGRESSEVDQGEAIEYASKYAFVALIMRYPWLMDPRKGAP